MKPPRLRLRVHWRWRVKEPFAEITVVSYSGMKATLEELETALKNGKPK